MAVLNQSQLQQILRQAGWPEDVIPLMSAIGMAESSGRTTAVNNRPGREYSVGLWQINLLAHREYTATQMQDPRREFWHYQFDEGLTWQAAMEQINGPSK